MSVHASASGPSPHSMVRASRMKPGCASRWSEIAASPEFTTLVAAKRTIGPMLAFSIGFFLLVSLLCGLARPLRNERVAGSLGLGYVLVIAVYAVCWLTALAYVHVADSILDSRADAMAARLHRETRGVMKVLTLLIFCAILALTLWIIWWAARRTRTSSSFYAADAGLGAAENGFALAGDWMSALANDAANVAD